MYNSESILVLGTGELGSEVLRSLSLHNDRNSRPITVLLRPFPPDVDPTPKRKHQLAEFKTLNITILEANISEDSQSVLETIFGQYHTIIGCSGMTYPPGTQLKITRAVLPPMPAATSPGNLALITTSLGEEAHRTCSASS